MKNWSKLIAATVAWGLLLGFTVTAAVQTQNNKEISVEIRVLKTELNEARKTCKADPDGQATMLNQKGQFFSVPCSSLKEE